MNDKNITGLYCFLGGLGVGIAAAILLAPDSGVVTRNTIRRKAEQGRDLLNAKAEEGRDYLKRQGAKLADRTNEFVERGKRAMSEQKDKVASAVEAGKLAYRSAGANPENSRAEN
jgi:gas vesicle protein